MTDLPSLPQVLVKLVEACYRVDATFEQIAGWVELDPGLSAKALSLLGHTRPRPRIGALPALLKELGRDALKALAVASAARESSAAKGALPVSLGFWRRSLHCAVTCRLLAVATGYRSPDEAYLAGLLHNLGQLVLQTMHPEKYEALRRKAQRDTQLLLLEREQFGAGHNDLGAELIRSWRLQSFLADAARYHHQPLGYVLDAHPLVKIVFLANLLSHGESRPLETAFEAAEQLFGLGQGALAELISRAGEAVAEFGRTLDLPPSRAPAPALKPEPATARLADKVAQIALLDGVRPRLNRASDRPELLRALARSARLIVGDRKCLFFVRDSGQTVLTGFDPSGDIELAAELEIDPDAGTSMICRSVDEQRPIHSFEEEAPPLAVVDRQIMNLLESAGMLCLPLVAGEARLGALVLGIQRAHQARFELQRDLLAAFASDAASQLLAIERPTPPVEAVGPGEAADARTRQIVHEVNNPLSIARNYLQVLGMKLGATHPASKDLKVIEEELIRVSELVLQLTEAAEVAAPPREIVALNSLITDLLRVSRESLTVPKEIEVELSLDNELPPILSSASSLKQILINLVQNASEAMKRGGKLRIRTRDWHRVDATPFVEIEVSDEGPGIPPEVQARMFKPLASTKGRGHAGLGLSIVKRLVEELGGSIGYQSDDKGSTFRVLLPRVLGERRAPAE